MKKIKNYKFSYPKDIRFLHIMREDMKRELYDKKELNNILFITGEIFTNFIRHTKSEKNSILNVKISFSEKHTELEFVYKDNSYKELNIIAPDMKKLPSGGYGLFMIKKMAVDFKIDFSEKDSLIFMKIKIKKK